MASVSNTPANERLEARVTPEQKQLFREAATLQGVTLTNFVVSSVHRAAIRTLEARDVLELTRNDQKVFVRALLQLPSPNKRLRAAWSKYQSSGQGSPAGARHVKTRRAR